MPGSIAQNLAYPSPYSFAVPFLNMHKLHQCWYVAGYTSYTEATGTISGFVNGGGPITQADMYTYYMRSDGYPTQVDNGGSAPKCTWYRIMWDVGTFDYLDEDETIDVYFDGTGILCYIGIFVAGDIKSVERVATGHDRLTMNSPTNTGLGVAIVSSSSGDPVRNIRLIPNRWASAYAAGKKFNPEYVAWLQGFSTLRFMNWMTAITSKAQDWTDRYDENYSCWNAGVTTILPQYGVPIEVCCDLCNEVGVDGWMHIPFRATATYMANFAALVKSRLNSNRNIIMEVSNEFWNFNQDWWVSGSNAEWVRNNISSYISTYGLSWDNSTLATANTSPLNDNFLLQAVQTWLMKQAFVNEWTGADAARFKISICGQAAYNDRNQNYIMKPYSITSPPTWDGRIGTNVDCFGVAPYTTNDFPCCWSGQSGITKAISQLRNADQVPTSSGANTASGDSTATGVKADNSSQIDAGSTTIPLEAVGSGNIATGDQVAFQVESYGTIYDVVSGNSDVSAGGYIEIYPPLGTNITPTSGDTIRVYTDNISLTTDTSWGNGSLGATPDHGQFIRFVLPVGIKAGIVPRITVDTHANLFMHPWGRMANYGKSSSYGVWNSGTYAAYWQDGSQLTGRTPISVTGTANRGDGIIRITHSSTNRFTDGYGNSGHVVTVTGIVGTTEANGTWQIAYVDSTHIDLIADLSETPSSYSNAYSSGGTIEHTTGWCLMDQMGATTPSLTLETVTYFSGENRDVATYYGVELFCYESGQHHVDYQLQQNWTYDTWLFDFYEYVFASPEYYQYYRDYFYALLTEADGPVCHYQDVEGHSKWGYWGAVENYRSAPSQRYLALQSFFPLAVLNPAKLFLRFKRQRSYPPFTILR